MKAQEFVKTYQPKFSEYCPCVIDSQGEIHMCETSHLSTLIQLDGDNQILNQISSEVSPLFYLMEKSGCVLVDYENQIYSGALTKEQDEALFIMGEAKIISLRPKSIPKERIEA